MKKIIILLFICFSTLAFAEPPNEIVFFGDSLTDNGNLYKAFFKKMPKSPPYYEGRFSNGLNWADHLGDYYFKKYGATTSNYAVGGATTILHDPFKGYLPYDLQEEVNKYLVSHLLKNKSKTLFMIWMGANDYLNGSDNIEKDTDQVTTELYFIIDSLYVHGGRNFVILTLPDLSKTPYAQGVSYKETLQVLSQLHNQKLSNFVDKLKESHKDAKFYLFDSLSLLNDILQNPEKYNQKYHQNFKNTTDACWLGGYTVKNEQNNLASELQKALTENGAKGDSQIMSGYVYHSPALSEAYAVSNAFAQGITPCDKPDEYIFWDHVHPTAAVHDVLAQIVLENLAMNSA